MVTVRLDMMPYLLDERAAQRYSAYVTEYSGPDPCLGHAGNARILLVVFPRCPACFRTFCHTV